MTVSNQSIARAFDRAADTYDTAASIQRRLAERLVEGIPSLSGNILDIGCGTGLVFDCLPAVSATIRLTGIDIAPLMLKQAYRKHPHASFITASSEALPFDDNSFNTILSSAALQWAQPFHQSLHEIIRVLKPGGTFHCAFFTEGTLEELYDAFAAVCDENIRIHTYPTRNDANAFFSQYSLRAYTDEVFSLTEWYSDIPALLRNLKLTGVASNRKAQKQLLFSRSRITVMETVYRRKYSTSHELPATYNCCIIRGKL